MDVFPNMNLFLTKAYGEAPGFILSRGQRYGKSLPLLVLFVLLVSRFARYGAACCLLCGFDVLLLVRFLLCVCLCVKSVFESLIAQGPD